MTTPTPPNRLRGNLLLLVTAIVWGFSFVAQVAGGKHVEAFTFNGTRFGLGALSLLPLIALLDSRASRGSAARRTSWRAALVPGVVAGLVLFVASWLQQRGMESTSAGNGGFITGLYMVLVPVIGLALGQRTRWWTWAGIVLAVTGLYLLSVKEGFTMSPGDALVLGGTLFWAAHILIVDRFAGRLDPLRLSVVQFAACSVYNLLAAPMLETHPYGGLPDAVVPVLYGGLMSVGVAYTLQVVGQRDALPSHAAMILSLESLFAAVGGALLLGETMSVRGYVGCALMMAGILLSQMGGEGSSDEPGTVPVPEPAPASVLDPDD